MRAPGRPSIFRAGSALAFVLVLLPLLGACTKGGQFDPTELLNNDTFDSKKKLSGQRESVFPGGVPGTTAGVPPDLVKGYQPPPDPADASQTPPGGGAPDAGPNAAGATATAEAKPKPKPKPRPKVATAPAQAPAQSGDPIWNQTQPAKGPTRINVGAKPAAPAPAQDQGASSQPNWPAPSQQMTPAQQVQTNWPNPPAATR
jgi:hypothetical protein